MNLVGDKHATFAFYTSKSSISREVADYHYHHCHFLIIFSQILDLAIGNHQLYLKRRHEQSIEMQQMKYFEEQQQKVCMSCLRH